MGIWYLVCYVRKSQPANDVFIENFITSLVRLETLVPKQPGCNEFVVYFLQKIAPALERVSEKNRSRLLKAVSDASRYFLFLFFVFCLFLFLFNYLLFPWFFDVVICVYIFRTPNTNICIPDMPQRPQLQLDSNLCSSASRLERIFIYLFISNSMFT